MLDDGFKRRRISAVLSQYFRRARLADPGEGRLFPYWDPCRVIYLPTYLPLVRRVDV